MNSTKYVAQGFWKLCGNRSGKNKGPRGRHNRQNLAHGIAIGVSVFTDYPLCKGALVSGLTYDEPYKQAPTRKVELLGYDYNKYCLIRFEGSIFEFKIFYCHIHEDQVSNYNDEEICKYIPAMPGYEIEYTSGGLVVLDGVKYEKHNRLIKGCLNMRVTCEDVYVDA
jgi:hypothetical protein